MLYLRMILSVGISLYTSRVILQTLGVSDYGVYGVVGGIVTMFSFFNASLAGATSRFLSVELGVGNRERIKDTFSSALLIHIAIAVVVTLLCETIGIWFLENKLVIPEGRMYAAHWVLQFSILTMVFHVIQVPFNAAIISNERMGTFAYIEIANSLLKLLIVYMLVIGNFDKLILYSILTCVVAILITLIYVIYSCRNFSECSLRLVWKKEYIKPMLSYSGWEFYGNMSLVASSQGINMLLNMFFGTIMNAAYDIANRVKNIIMSLSTNFTTAIRPQIYKNYSADNFERMFSLMQNGSRITFMLMLVFCAPLIIEAHYILNLWLGIVPEHSETLLRLALLWNIIVSMFITMNDASHATGDVKFQCLVSGTLYLAVLPLSYIAFLLNAPYWVPFALNALFVTVDPLYVGYVIKKHIPGFSWRKHVLHDMVRTYSILIVVIAVPYFIISNMEESFVRLVVTTILTTLITCVLGFYILLSKNLRGRIISFIKTKIKRS
jgi:Na+-driven multidrug efflux pump